MDIAATFLPVAVDLIDNIFPTDIVYRQPAASTYDPTTGLVTPGGTIDTPMKAGILSRGRTEEGGSNETYELRLYIHHGATGLQGVPETGDSVFYDGRSWKVTTADPTYSSDVLIASKITCRAA